MWEKAKSCNDDNNSVDDTCSHLNLSTLTSLYCYHLPTVLTCWSRRFQFIGFESNHDEICFRPCHHVVDVMLKCLCPITHETYWRHVNNNDSSEHGSLWWILQGFFQRRSKLLCETFVCTCQQLVWNKEEKERMCSVRACHDHSNGPTNELTNLQYFSIHTCFTVRRSPGCCQGHGSAHSCEKQGRCNDRLEGNWWWNLLFCWFGTSVFHMPVRQTGWILG